MNAIYKVAVQDPTFRRSCEVLLAVVFQSLNEIRFSPNVRRFFRSTVQAQGKKGFQVGFMQTAQALKFNIALVRSTMRSRYTIHAIVKYKIDLPSTNTQINKQYLQRLEYLYFISKIIIFGRAIKISSHDQKGSPLSTIIVMKIMRPCYDGNSNENVTLK